MSFIVFFQLFFLFFFLSLLGIFFNRKNVIILLLCIEFMLLSVNFLLLLGSCYLDDILAQNFAVFILTIAAAESSIGLAILIVYYRIKGTISVEQINMLKG